MSGEIALSLKLTPLALETAPCHTADIKMWTGEYCSASSKMGWPVGPGWPLNVHCIKDNGFTCVSLCIVSVGNADRRVVGCW